MNNRSRQYRRPGTHRPGSIVVGCLMALFFSLSVQAEEQPTATEEQIEKEETITLGGPLGSANRVSASDLDTHRAKSMLEVHKVTINDQELNGRVSNNTAINTNTGDNIVSTGAFTSSSGFISTVQNSGNNVLIQNSTIINVEIDP